MNTAYHAQRVNRPSFPWVKTFLFGFLLALFAVGLIIWLATGTGLLSLLRAYRGGTLIHIDQPTVVRQIQQLQRLETVSFTMDKIISGEHDSPYLPKFLVSDRLLLVVHGEVIGGVDLSKLQSADVVYCSHVLEHMALDEFRIALRNVFSYLRPGGTFRLVLPDLEQLIGIYTGDPTPAACSRFMQEAWLGETTIPRGLKSIPAAVFGRARHLWMWDYKGMAAQLAEAGFTDIRRAQMGDSHDPRFKEVESDYRWKDCLGVDCKRPA